MPAGPGGGAALRIDGVDLAQVAALVGGERALDGRGGLDALLP